MTERSEENGRLIIICGLPGAGKTTLAKDLEAETAGVRLSPDEWMQDFGITLWDEGFRDKLERRLWQLGSELLKLGQTVILEYGFWAKAERDDKLQAARAQGAAVELHYLDPPLDEMKRRLQDRGMEGDDIIVGKLEEYSEKFERPDKSELQLYDNHN